MFHSWLNDAYAMEMTKNDLLKRYAKDFEDYPDIKMNIEKVSSKAVEKADRLKSIIENMGEKVSMMKSFTGKLTGMWQSATSELTHDQIVKHLLVMYSGANLGIASYLSLAAAAKELGRDEVANFANDSITETREFVQWLEDRIPEVTIEFLQKEHTNQ